ncbi:ornithine carbamoyltransferase [Mycoemilia scoparia]|uniref:ornithine carbamoyltransferase n=1 Tax=Mycoemilia scoparia TaxID=417184 RepID=A0A9W8A7L1_9FUNG|nr:ornithine carbamoyltransferase [Mycoemilia scoparia]
MTVPAKTNPTPKHMLSLVDYSSDEIFSLIEASIKHKHDAKVKGKAYADGLPLQGKVVAIMFSKRSTRTRVATETAVTYLGGHPMFIGAQDIHLGVNEPLRDTSQIISSMVECIMARVNEHEEIKELAHYSSVPVVNALSEDYHPTQILADIQTIHEVFGKEGQSVAESVKGINVAWVGDSNNVLYEMLAAFPKCGINLTIATPSDYPVPSKFLEPALADAKASGATISVGTDPVKAINGADIVVTDTWVSMGHETEKDDRLAQFKGYQITSELIKEGNPSPNWRFMHCLPRKQEEVTDEVFYSDRSIVFQEAENRKWTIIATLEHLLVDVPSKN